MEEVQTTYCFTMTQILTMCCYIVGAFMVVALSVKMLKDPTPEEISAMISQEEKKQALPDILPNFFSRARQAPKQESEESNL